MNGCKVLLVPFCALAEEGSWNQCDHAPLGLGEDPCPYYTWVPTDLGEFHRCGHQGAIDEAVADSRGYYPDDFDPPSLEAQELEDYAQDGDFFNREVDE